LERLAHNPILSPSDIRFTEASGVFNAGASVDWRSGRVVLLARVFERDARRSCFALAISSDGLHIDEVRDRPAMVPDAPYEEYGVEDPRVTWLADEGRYAITYVGYSPAGPRVCLMTTDDLLDPSRYRRHGPRLQGENKNAMVLPEKIGGRYLVLHRPMPDMVLAEVARLEDPWPEGGHHLLGPQAGTWRSARVGAGAPPERTRLGWLLPFHGATTIAEGNVYSMGWCLLDGDDPTRVRWVSEAPALAPEAAYEIEPGPLPQVDMRSFPRGIRVVFPQGMVLRGDQRLVYYGAADLHVAVARVSNEALLGSIAAQLP
jgi:predicted GH43/DUF377 family glycosyl hydrolase